ncbi:glutathione peroxidase [Verrucomicrobia bacterium S94]|nr:glutathione peroxidase [Verrucomicrobia bacterium S94]
MNLFYDLKAETVSGRIVKMAAYKGKVLLIVNTAGKCGFTRQYEGLQRLYEAYQGQGFEILGFPSNDFLKQEPGSNEAIASFCKLNYGITFTIFRKIAVKGPGRHPLYSYLTSPENNPVYGGKISWNFNKFLISRNGEVAGRFGSRTKPQNPDLIAAIKKELNPP